MFSHSITARHNSNVSSYVTHQIPNITALFIILHFQYYNLLLQWQSSSPLYSQQPPNTLSDTYHPMSISLSVDYIPFLLVNLLNGSHDSCY